MLMLRWRISVTTDLLLLLLLISGIFGANIGLSMVISLFFCHPCVYTPWLIICPFVFTVVIPNAEEIKAARRQRHNIQTQKDFIPLSRAGHSSAGSTPEHYSREEERVDDDDDEHDDHERRIEFAPRLKSIRERIAEKLGMRVRDGLGETDLNILNIFNMF